MLIIDNIKNFLYDKKYFINIFDNYIHVFNYIKLNDFNDSMIKLSFLDFDLIIKGKNLFITKMLKNELLIKGELLTMEKIYE